MGRLHRPEDRLGSAISSTEPCATSTKPSAFNASYVLLFRLKRFADNAEFLHVGPLPASLRTADSAPLRSVNMATIASFLVTV